MANLTEDQYRKVQKRTDPEATAWKAENKRRVDAMDHSYDNPDLSVPSHGNTSELSELPLKRKKPE